MGGYKEWSLKIIGTEGGACAAELASNGLVLQLSY